MNSTLYIVVFQLRLVQSFDHQSIWVSQTWPLNHGWEHLQQRFDGEGFGIWVLGGFTTKGIYLWYFKVPVFLSLHIIYIYRTPSIFLLKASTWLCSSNYSNGFFKTVKLFLTQSKFMYMDLKHKYPTLNPKSVWIWTQRARTKCTLP